MSLFDINNIFFTIWGYSMSYLEFTGTLAGFIAVWISAKANVWSWPIGIINVILLFFLFYQVQLYPDMFLQIFFFITNVMGWWRWKHPQPGEEDKKRELKISYLNNNWRGLSAAIILFGTMILGTAALNLNSWFPSLFPQPSAFPFLDSFVTVTSIVAQYWMLQKKVECWLFWILADIIATYLYFAKDVRFLGLEYLIFCFIAISGFYTWMKEERFYHSNS